MSRTSITRGSSPLARGLRLDSRPDGALDRIIPARAGFTPRWSTSTSPPPDHPRSRGVYLIRGAGERVIRGSSPLARGLPAAGIRHEYHGRIIPARAGFTARQSRAACSATDHPRSRGVYEISCTAPRSKRGSSPLARGLPDEITEPTTFSGIIPARAGFTYYTRSVPPSGPDHPRSRGVYGWHDCDPVSEGGSSPLARGLRRQRRDRVLQ